MINTLLVLILLLIWVVVVTVTAMDTFDAPSYLRARQRIENSVLRRTGRTRMPRRASHEVEPDLPELPDLAALMLRDDRQDEELWRLRSRLQDPPYSPELSRDKADAPSISEF